jgi:Flp pilus assembly protein TadD
MSVVLVAAPPSGEKVELRRLRVPLPPDRALPVAAKRALAYVASQRGGAEGASQVAPAGTRPIDSCLREVQMVHRTGVTLREKGDAEGAIAAYREALRIEPNDSKAHNSLGLALGDKGDREGELVEYREAIRLNPRYAAAHYNLGITLEQKGDLQGAFQEFRAAYNLNSSDPDYRKAYERLSRQGQK